MIRYLTEDDVKQILTMTLAVELVEEALRARAEGHAVDVPRVRARNPAGTLHMMGAAAPALKRTGFKAYYSGAGKDARYHVHLFDTDTGKLDAMVEASHLGMVRTGAASGVATHHLACDDATVLAMIGAGKQAVGQLEAVCEVRKIREVRVFSRSAERAKGFCATMGAKLGIAMHVAASGQAAVRGADVINVITKSATPVLEGPWLEPGQHINAAGANALSRRELDDAAVRRSTCVVVDSRATARNESGDLLSSVEAGFLDWESVAELGEVIVGRAVGRESGEDITLYESHGMAIQDIYVATEVVVLARKRGIGTDLPIGV